MAAAAAAALVTSPAPLYELETDAAPVTHHPAAFPGAVSSAADPEQTVPAAGLSPWNLTDSWKPWRCAQLNPLPPCTSAVTPSLTRALTSNSSTTAELRNIPPRWPRPSIPSLCGAPPSLFPPRQCLCRSHQHACMPRSVLRVMQNPLRSHAAPSAGDGLWNGRAALERAAKELPSTAGGASCKEAAAELRLGFD